MHHRVNLAPTHGVLMLGYFCRKVLVCGGAAGGILRDRYGTVG